MAGCSIDRAALRAFADATKTENMESLVCAICACTYARARTLGSANKIAWRSPVTVVGGEVMFLNRRLYLVEHHLGLHGYLAKYGNMENCPNFAESIEFDDWYLDVPDADGVCGGSVDF